MSPRKCVLLVDDDAGRVDHFARQLGSLGLLTLTAHDVLTAVNLIEHEAIDLVLLDADLPAAGSLSCGELLSATDQLLPLVLLTDHLDDAVRQRCSELGVYCLTKTSDPWPRLRDLLSELLQLQLELVRDAANRSQSLIERVFEITGAWESLLDASPAGTGGRADVDEPTGGPWVLCIEDDRDFSLALQLRLGTIGISVVRAFEGIEGFQTALRRPADAILLDYNLPNGRGDDVLRRLKANRVTREIPVIVVSGQKRAGLEKEMLHLGARFFAKPVRFEELVEELQRYVPVTI